MTKKPTVVHLTEEGMRWLQELASENGVSNSVMVEKLVRKRAVEEGKPDAKEWK